MKIPTSTSFVMAATASLALQSSARAVPLPDSPDLTQVSSPRVGSTAQFSGAPDANGEASPRRSMKLRADAPSTDPIEALLNEELAGLSGLKMRAADKDADSNVAALAARQVPVPISPGVSADPATNIPNGAVQQGPSTVSSVMPGAPQPQLPQGAPAPPGLPASLPVSPAQGIAGVSPPGPPLPVDPPVSVLNSGVMRRDDNAFQPTSYLPNTAGQVVGGAVGSGTGLANPVASTIGNVPVVGSTAPNPLGVAEGALGDVSNAVPNVGNVVQTTTGGTPLSQVTGSNPVGQIVGSTLPGQLAPNGLPFSSLQGQADSDGDEDNEGNGNVLASPSSTVAAPSSSPSSSPVSSPSSSPAVASSTYDSTVSPTATPVVGMKRAVGPFNNLPLSGAFVPISLPTPSTPAQVSQTDGAPAHVVPSLPVSPPVSPPDSLPVSPPTGIPASLPNGASVSPPVNPLDAPVSLPALPTLPVRRTLGVRGGPRSPTMPMFIDLPLPSGFPAPSAPIQDDEPPLLLGARDDVGADVSASVSHQAPPTGTVQPGTSMLPTSRVSTATAMEASMTATSQPSRRRLFRFGREENA